jgi:NhaP-type Na+/H+ or K+/H+ antiporter
LIGKVFYVSILSIIIGVVGGLIPALFLKLFKKLHFNPISETVFLMIFGFGTYLISEML